MGSDVVVSFGGSGKWGFQKTILDVHVMELKMLEASQKHNVKKFIYCSTAE